MTNEHKNILIIASTLFFILMGLGAGDEMHQLVENQNRYDGYDMGRGFIVMFGSIAVLFSCGMSLAITASSSVDDTNPKGAMIMTAVLCIISGFSGSLTYGAIVGPLSQSFFDYWIVIWIVGLIPIGLFSYHLMMHQTESKEESTSVSTEKF